MTFYNFESAPAMGLQPGARRGQGSRKKAQHIPSIGTCAFLFQTPAHVTLATTPPVNDWMKFKRLVSEWHCERGAMSSITEAVLCPAYQSLIGMGEAAVPFILSQLESEGTNPDQWFWALRAITGADPVEESDRGNYLRMAESWLKWGMTNGYVR